MTTQSKPKAPGLSYGQLQQTVPAALDALLSLSKAVDSSGLEKTLMELVRLRVSQINHCAFCTQMHLNAARRAGVAPDKLDLIATWQSADIFSLQERAALAWAEHLTYIASDMANETTHAALRQHFSAEETLHLTIAVAEINAWNRIVGGLHFPPSVSSLRESPLP